MERRLLYTNTSSAVPKQKQQHRRRRLPVAPRHAGAFSSTLCPDELPSSILTLTEKQQWIIWASHSGTFSGSLSCSLFLFELLPHFCFSDSGIFHEFVFCGLWRNTAQCPEASLESKKQIKTKQKKKIFPVLFRSYSWKSVLIKAFKCLLFWDVCKDRDPELSDRKK